MGREDAISECLARQALNQIKTVQVEQPVQLGLAQKKHVIPKCMKNKLKPDHVQQKTVNHRNLPCF
jgi:hypothetical protein